MRITVRSTNAHFGTIAAILVEAWGAAHEVASPTPLIWADAGVVSAAEVHIFDEASSPSMLSNSDGCQDGGVIMEVPGNCAETSELSCAPEFSSVATMPIMEAYWKATSLGKVCKSDFSHRTVSWSCSTTTFDMVV